MNIDEVIPSAKKITKYIFFIIYFPYINNLVVEKNNGYVTCNKAYDKW